MAQEGVLGRVSGRSWVSRACWEGPHPALGHPTPSAGVLPACRGGPRGVLGVMGTWEAAGVLPGISAVLHCPWDADCSCPSIWVAASRRTADRHGARGPEAPPKITCMSNGGKAKRCAPRAGVVRG